MGLFDWLGGGDHGASGYLKDYQSTLNQQQGVAGQYGNLASQTGADYNTYASGQRQAISNYANLLQQDPYTDSYSTAALNQATNGMSRDYESAKASLTADLARRGFSSTGQGSSMLSGGLSGIEAARAGQVANAQNNLAMQKINQQYQNASNLANLYSGAASNAYGQTTGALGAESGVLGNVGQGQMGLYQNALQQQQAQANGILSFVGGLANIGGGVLEAKLGKK